MVDYRGLTVEQDTQLRKQFREAGVTYKVYKNTMIRFAAKGTAFEALEPHLEGPTALAVSKEDATAPARIIAEFAKKADKLEMEGSLEACSRRLRTLPVWLSRSRKSRERRRIRLKSVGKGDCRHAM